MNLLNLSQLLVALHCKNIWNILEINACVCSLIVLLDVVFKDIFPVIASQKCTKM
jgi:hypothetical protein